MKLDIKIKCESMEINMQTGIIELSNVDFQTIMNSVKEETSITDILNAINQDLTAVEYCDLIEWIDENHDLSYMANELPDDRRREIKAAINSEEE